MPIHPKQLLQSKHSSRSCRRKCHQDTFAILAKCFRRRSAPTAAIAAASNPSNVQDPRQTGIRLTSRRYDSIWIVCVRTSALPLALGPCSTRREAISLASASRLSLISLANSSGRCWRINSKRSRGLPSVPQQARAKRRVRSGATSRTADRPATFQRLASCLRLNHNSISRGCAVQHELLDCPSQFGDYVGVHFTLRLGSRLSSRVCPSGRCLPGCKLNDFLSVSGWHNIPITARPLLVSRVAGSAETPDCYLCVPTPTQAHQHY